MNRKKIEYALRKLNYTKGQLMNLVYGKDYSGIDSAIPQEYVDKYLMGENLYYYCTDCRKFPYKVINLLDELTEEKKALLCVYADVIRDMEDMKIDFSRKVINLLDELTEEKKALLCVYADVIRDMEDMKIDFSRALIISDYIREKL
jgi:hypothetical protein